MGTKHVVKRIGEPFGWTTMSCAGSGGEQPSDKLPDRCGGDECEGCGTRVEECAADPYESDVNDDDTPVLLCAPCRNARAQDL
jgi:hypothetical protein